jgi:nitroreductase
MKNTVSQVIKSRRSVFPAQYNKEPISKAELDQILEAANWAPTHKKTEPWRFKVMQGASQEALGLFLAQTFKNTTPDFSEFKYNKLKENPKKAGAIIAVCMQRDVKERIPEWEEVAATAMAVQNMWLVAHEMTIGAYWSSPKLIQYAGDFFHLAKHEKCLGFLYLGKYDGDLSPNNRNSPIEDKTVWV